MRFLLDSVWVGCRGMGLGRTTLDKTFSSTARPNDPSPGHRLATSPHTPPHSLPLNIPKPRHPFPAEPISIPSPLHPLPTTTQQGAHPLPALPPKKDNRAQTPVANSDLMRTPCLIRWPPAPHPTITVAAAIAPWTSYPRLPTLPRFIAHSHSLSHTLSHTYSLTLSHTLSLFVTHARVHMKFTCQQRCVCARAASVTTPGHVRVWGRRYANGLQRGVGEGREARECPCAVTGVCVM